MQRSAQGQGQALFRDASLQKLAGMPYQLKLCDATKTNNTILSKE